MPLPAAFLAWLVFSTAAAQGMFKCKDAAGKITYSGKECHLIGQTDAGAVTGRAVVTPAVKSDPNIFSAPAAPASASAAASQRAAVDSKPPAEPEKRCFTVKTAKGFVTRCNDKPDEEDAASK